MTPKASAGCARSYRQASLSLRCSLARFLYDLTQFNKTLDAIKTDEDRWLYLLKNAGSSDELPDFDDDAIARAIKRLLVKTALDSLLKEQAKNMVMTEEELDYLASLKVRARAQGKAEGLAEGLAEGESKGHADAIDVLKDMNFSAEQIAEVKARLAAKNT